MEVAAPVKIVKEEPPKKVAQPHQNWLEKQKQEAAQAVDIEQETAKPEEIKKSKKSKKKQQ